MIDYVTEKPYLDSIAALYDKLAVATSDSGTGRKNIHMEIGHITKVIANFLSLTL